MGRKLSTIDAFISRANDLHHCKYDYNKSIYVGALSKIEIICPKHGSFWQKANAHLLGQGCIMCRNEHFSKTNTHCIEEFIDHAKIVHQNKYDYSEVEYKRSGEKVKITCPDHGMFMQAPEHHLLGHGCHQCARLATSYANKLDLGGFILISNGIHHSFYDYSKSVYLGMDKQIEVICPKHGSFWQRAGAHSRGNGCSVCRPLSSEKENEWLNNLGIPNDKDHRQVKIVLGKSFVIVDGFDSITNTVYEFHGDYWHGNPKIFKSSDINPSNKRSYGDLYKETIDRENMIKKNGYNMITIWENDWKQERKNFNATTK